MLLKMVKLNTFIFIMCIVSSCNSTRPTEQQKVTVTTFQKVGEGYSYSRDLLQYNGGTYRPVVTGMYVKDSLTGAAVFKPEGKLEYSKKDLDEDTLFKSTLSLPDLRKIKVTEKEVTDNEIRFGITERKNDSVFCLRSDTLLLYYFH